ncbi:MAG TPA: PilZ domain-containing protein [Novosphingobium sp.]|nr:PilZ domain-containing protein [Novosphingobium sp.]
MIHKKLTVDHPLDRTKARRAKLTLLCEARQGTRPWAMVQIDDLSQAGFRIIWLPQFSLGSPLRIRIPRMQVLTATIRWHEGKTLGCEFVEPLHVAVFEHIVRSAVIDAPLSR